MFLIAGLGNPGREYENTRHNIGYMLIDALAEKYGISVRDIKNKALTGKGIICGQKVILIKPLTYMNLSGESIETEVLVVSDDISLPPGLIRVRKKGSAGGHNGLKNIILHLGTENFQRVRIGVGEKPKGYDLADYVLGHFDRQEQPLIREGIEKAVTAVELMLSGETDQAMNEFNRKVSQEGQEKK